MATAKAKTAGDVKPYQNISLGDAKHVIATVGSRIVVMVRGEMGIGKSYLLKELAKDFPDHIPCYVDMTTKDVGDLLMPKVVEVDGMWVCSFIPNAEFGFQFHKPLILMWDELTKANKTIQTQCIRALQEWQLGEHKLPEGTIQFATGNLAEEGVLDALMPHHQNRIMQITVRKPTDKEWIEDFALNNNVHPTVIQSVSEFPDMLASWTFYPNSDHSNQYIYDPRKPRPSFVTPRSLEKVSDFLWANEARGESLPYDVKVHAIAGLVGEPAAMDIMNIDALYEQLPKWEDIVKNPKDTPIPTDAGVQCLMVYSAIQRVEKETCSALVTYIERAPRETQALLATTVVQTHKSDMMTANQKFFDWALENNWLIANNA